jgi:signal transduction histidine kinase
MLCPILTRMNLKSPGLRKMRKRAWQIDGKLDIYTVTGQGKTIVLTVPIPS